MEAETDVDPDLLEEPVAVAFAELDVIVGNRPGALFVR